MTKKIKKITTSEAAKLLGISGARIRQLIEAGVIPAERVGNFYVLKDRDVKAAKDRKPGRPRKNPLKTTENVGIAPDFGFLVSPKSSSPEMSDLERRLAELDDIFKSKKDAEQSNSNSMMQTPVKY
jgi:excisionase family DNA binding protein